MPRHHGDVGDNDNDNVWLSSLCVWLVIIIVFFRCCLDALSLSNVNFFFVCMCVINETIQNWMNEFGCNFFFYRKKNCLSQQQYSIDRWFDKMIIFFLTLSLSLSLFLFVCWSRIFHLSGVVVVVVVDAGDGGGDAICLSWFDLPVI